jgi:hypothetical protein
MHYITYKIYVRVTSYKKLNFLQFFFLIEDVGTLSAWQISVVKLNCGNI